EEEAGPFSGQREEGGRHTGLPNRSLSGPMRPEQNKTVQAEIAHLDDLGLDDLRELWNQILGHVPPHHGTALLRRRLAYELQARVHGDLSADIRKRLTRLHKAFKTNPAYTPLRGRGVKPGTVLTRTWRGVTHQVRATDQ